MLNGSTPFNIHTKVILMAVLPIILANLLFAASTPVLYIYVIAKFVREIYD